MLSNLRPSDASPLLKHLQNLEGRGEQPEDRNMWDHFRGAFGHTIGEQVSMYEWNTAGKKDVEVDDRQATSMCFDIVYEIAVLSHSTRQT
jgi:hypothetical protein